MGFDNHPELRREQTLTFAADVRGVLRGHFEGELFTSQLPEGKVIQPSPV